MYTNNLSLAFGILTMFGHDQYVYIYIKKTISLTSFDLTKVSRSISFLNLN